MVVISGFVEIDYLDGVIVVEVVMIEEMLCVIEELFIGSDGLIGVVVFCDY